MHIFLISPAQVLPFNESPGCHARSFERGENS
jgi:hypothetical protein